MGGLLGGFGLGGSSGGSGGLLGSILNPIIGAPPTPPTPIDPSQILDLENKYNRINQNTPFGSLTFGPNGATMGLSPAYQKIFGRATRGLTGLLGMGGINQYTQDAYDKAMQLLSPQLQQQQDQFTQNLADRGLPAGSQLGDSLTQNFDQGQNDLRLQTAMGAIQQGQAERQQRYQMLLGALGTVPNLNSFYAPSPVDVGGAYGLNVGMQNNAFNNANDIYQSELSGLFKLGNAAGSAAMGGGG